MLSLSYSVVIISQMKTARVIISLTSYIGTIFYMIYSIIWYVDNFVDMKCWYYDWYDILL
jgi:hypothetical protein